MLIFNGKKYFVPFIVKEKIEGADATPEQVVEGVKFVGAKGVVEKGKLPFYDGEDLPAAVYKHNNEYLYVQSHVNKTSIIEDVVYSKVPLSQFSCTLVFAVDNYGNLYVAYTKSDGTAHFDTLPPNVDTTIEGIMCGSVITMYSQQGSYFSPNGVPITELGTLGSCNLYSAPTESGTYRLPFDRS